MIWLNSICDDTIPEKVWDDVFLDFVSTETGLIGWMDGEHLAKHLNTKYGVTQAEFNTVRASCFADITEDDEDHSEEHSEGKGLKLVRGAISEVHEVVENL